jgi:HSP20 family molecular chaperone IbpA
MIAVDPRSWMWSEACEMIERAERLQRQFFSPGFPASHSASWEPPVDIFETGRELWIFAALPGVAPERLDVSIEAGELKISGSRPLPALARGAAIHRLEIPYGRFERRVRLPTGRFEVIRSELVSGCLAVHLMRQG